MERLKTSKMRKVLSQGHPEVLSQGHPVVRQSEAGTPKKRAMAIFLGVLLSLRATTDELYEFPILGASIPMPIVNLELQELIGRKFSGQFQWMGVEIRCTDGVVKTYRILHVINKSFSEIDLKRSGYDIVGDLSIPFVSADAMGDLDVCMAPDYCFDYLVSRKFYKALNSHSGVGEFLTVEEAVSMEPKRFGQD